MDSIGWYIATMHSLLGHDAAATALQQPRGDRAACLICRYEQSWTAEDRRAVEQALAPAGSSVDGGQQQ